MTRDILVAVDHSDSARKAFDYAVKFIAHKGEDSNDILHLVHYVKEKRRRSASRRFVCGPAMSIYPIHPPRGIEDVIRVLPVWPGISCSPRKHTARDETPTSWEVIFSTWWM